MINKIVSEIVSNAPEICPKIIERAFQTQPGGYGFGDKFIGTRVPILRKIAKKYKDISLKDSELLLQNPLHEARFTALVILVKHFKKHPECVFQIYKSNTKHINNWDLVDVSSQWIVGNYCLLNHKNDQILEFANSDDLWENRIAIVSSWAFIKKNYFQLTFDLCEHFMQHEHHLIHKACGWMLREVSKRDPLQVIEFVNDHKMPSIMRSYALESIRKMQKQ